jgi:hypothetical protein
MAEDYKENLQNLSHYEIGNNPTNPEITCTDTKGMEKQYQAPTLEQALARFTQEDWQNIEEFGEHAKLVITPLVSLNKKTEALNAHPNTAIKQTSTTFGLDMNKEWDGTDTESQTGSPAYEPKDIDPDPKKHKGKTTAQLVEEHQGFLVTIVNANPNLETPGHIVITGENWGKWQKSVFKEYKAKGIRLLNQHEDTWLKMMSIQKAITTEDVLDGDKWNITGTILTNTARVACLGWGRGSARLGVLWNNPTSDNGAVRFRPSVMGRVVSRVLGSEAGQKESGEGAGVTDDGEVEKVGERKEVGTTFGASPSEGPIESRGH